MFGLRCPGSSFPPIVLPKPDNRFCQQNRQSDHAADAWKISERMLQESHWQRPDVKTEWLAP